MRRNTTLNVIGWSLAAALTLPAFAEESELWQDGGADFEPQRPLPDFSYAGYHRGEAELPEREPDVSVLDFDAAPDDDTDDTEAFRKAIAGSAGKCIAVPAGRYILSDTLVIDQSQTVLQGEGPGKTILHFTRGLEEITPQRTRTGHGSPTTAWSWSGGLIRIGGSAFTGDKTAKPASTAERGSRVLQLDSNPFAAGDEVVIDARDPGDASLTEYVYEGDIREKHTDIGRVRLRMVAKVAEVDGKSVTLDRPLRFEARSEWVTVSAFEPGVVESGVERLTVDFPARPYKGHFTEDGLNGFAITNAAHCWLRDIEIVNADSGAFMGGSFNTVDGVVFRSEREPDNRGNTGHHGLTSNGSDNLITRFDFQTRFIHDLTVTSGSVGNVWSDGKAVDLNMDHHRRAPYQNLFTNLDAGAGTRYFSSGGTSTRGRHTAAGETFWNIRGEQDAKMPGSDFGPAGIFFVGVQGLNPDEAKEGWHVEAIEPGELEPANLHEAQLERRLAKEK